LFVFDEKTRRKINILFAFDEKKLVDLERVNELNIGKLPTDILLTNDVGTNGAATGNCPHPLFPSEFKHVELEIFLEAGFYCIRDLSPVS
jgi:hypothetical protein